MSPILIEQPYNITYLHSFGQDSPFFAGLANGTFLVTKEPESGYTYGTPRGHDMYSGEETEWVEIPAEGKVHAFTVCHFGSEEFLPECPFVLALIDFPGVDTLFLARLIGVEPEDIDTQSLELTPVIQMKIEPVIEMVLAELEQLGVSWTTAKHPEGRS